MIPGLHDLGGDQKVLDLQERMTTLQATSVSSDALVGYRLPARQARDYAR